MPPICKKTNKIVLFCTYSKGCGASLDQTLKFVRCPKHRKSSRISKRVYRCLEKGVDPVTSDEEAVEQRTRTLAEKVREKQHRTCDARRHRGSNSSRDDSSSVVRTQHSRYISLPLCSLTVISAHFRGGTPFFTPVPLVIDRASCAQIPGRIWK